MQDINVPFFITGLLVAGVGYVAFFITLGYYLAQAIFG